MFLGCFFWFGFLEDVAVEGVVVEDVVDMGAVFVFFGGLVVDDGFADFFAEFGEVFDGGEGDDAGVLAGGWVGLCFDDPFTIFFVYFFYFFL